MHHHFMHPSSVNPFVILINANPKYVNQYMRRIIERNSGS